jgi:hypothetical protein
MTINSGRGRSCLIVWKRKPDPLTAAGKRDRDDFTEEPASSLIQVKLRGSNSVYKEKRGDGSVRPKRICAGADTQYCRWRSVCFDWLSWKFIPYINSIYIHDMEATVENGKIANCRINAKISFLLE